MSHVKFRISLLATVLAVMLGPQLAAGTPAPWLSWVDEPTTDTEVQRIRQIVNRSTPFGSETWTAVTAPLLGLDASLRPIGRPPKLMEP